MSENSSGGGLPRDEIDAERRALRILLDSFHLEQETLLEDTLDDPAIRSKIGKAIGHTFVKPCFGEC